MFQPFFNNNLKIIQYVLLWIGFAILQTLSLSILLPLPIVILIADGLFHAFVYGVVGVLLWNVLKYGNFNSLPFFQRVINYTALILLFLIVSVAAGYGFDYLLGNEVILFFEPFLPLRGLLTLMVYYILIQHFRLMNFDDNEGIVAETDEKENVEKIATTNDLEVGQESEKTGIEKELLERIAVKTGTKIHVVLVSEILYLQADGDYVQLYTMGGKYLKEQTMKYFEEHLPTAMFVRVHRSYIVNVEAISRIDLYEKQTQQLTLKNGHQLKISQSGFKALRLKLKL